MIEFPPSPISTQLNLGDVSGFVVEYDTTTDVLISAGKIEANGKVYELSSDDTHAMTGLIATQDFHYIYIDDSASTAPVAVFIDSTTEPAYSFAKQGWYNGNDRCIGVVVSEIGSAIVAPFFAALEGEKVVKYSVDRLTFASMAENFVPTGSWQVPTNDGDVVTPVNAVQLYVHGRSDDIGSFCEVSAVNKEMGDLHAGKDGAYVYTEAYDRASITSWLPLGSTRKMYIAAQGDDDNALTFQSLGWAISR